MIERTSGNLGRFFIVVVLAGIHFRSVDVAIIVACLILMFLKSPE